MFCHCLPQDMCRGYNHDLMDIKILSEKMHNFVNSRGWYQEDSIHPQTLRNLAISLNLETSEVLENFQWNELPGRTDELAAELADVALYLFQIANVAGIDLEKAILKKLEDNYGRIWTRDNE